METHVDYKIKAEPLGRQYLGKWCLTLIKQVICGSLLTEQPLYFNRLFNSAENAEDKGRRWISLLG